MCFTNRFHAVADVRSAFCLGVDPSAAVLAHWGVADTPQGLREFCVALAEDVGDSPALVKPQSAYFERHGAAGMQALHEFIATMRARGILVLLDVKRGDIGETNAAYAEGLFGAAGFAADAITVQPFMGFATLAPYFAVARTAGAHVFVITASSNPEGIALQQAKMAGGASVSEHISAAIAEENAQGSVCGAVVGATRQDITDTMRAHLRDALILAPGVGAQGAGYDAFATFPVARNIIPTSARGVLLAEDFRDALAKQCEAARGLRG